MKNLIAIILILLSSLSLQKSGQSDCQWTDEHGYSYDLSDLDKPDGWQIKDEESGMGMFSMVYVFNFCNFSKVKCHERQVGVYEALAVMGQITENCDVVGSSETRSVKHIDPNNPNKGIRISFGLGDLCVDIEGNPDMFKQVQQGKPGQMQPREAYFDIECPTNGRSDAEFSVIPGSECIDQFRIRHTIGCKEGQGSSISGKIFKWTLLCFILYMVGMYVYNVKKLGLAGYDAVPHNQQWIILGNELNAFLHQGFAFTKQQFAKYRGGQGAGYSTV